MDWVVFTSCIVLIITVIFDIIKSIKDKNGLSDEHKSLKENQKSLSNEHSRIEGIIKEEARRNEHTFEKSSSQIFNTLSHVDRMLIKEIERNNLSQYNLTKNQLDIKQSITAIENLMKEVERLQSLSVEQQNTISELRQENRILKEQLIQIHQQYHTNDNSFTQNM